MPLLANFRCRKRVIDDRVGGAGRARVQTYMCLLFDGANHVRSIEKIQAAEDNSAMAEAARLSHNAKQAIGYELWKNGHKIASYFRPLTVAGSAA